MRGIDGSPRLAAAVLLCAAGLAGCALFPDFSGSARIEVQQLRSLAVCNSESPQPQVTLLADALAVRAWQEAHRIDLTGGSPLPTAGAYVVAEMGLHTSAGYAIAISRQGRLSGDTVTLSATLLAPPPDAAAADMITSPCVLVALPSAVYRNVELRDGGDALLARYRAP